MNSKIILTSSIFIISLGIIFLGNLSVSAYQDNLDYRMLSDKIILDFTYDSDNNISIENLLINFNGEWIDIDNMSILDSTKNKAWIIGNIDDKNQFYITYIYHNDKSGKLGLFVYDGKNIIKDIMNFRIFEF